jgi:nickel-dependent lactate racemase
MGIERGQASIVVPFGESEVLFNPGSAEVIGVLDIAETAPLLNLKASLIARLNQPISSKPLRELAAGAQRVAIITDDATRPTPAAPIIPHVLDELLAGGVRKEDISFVMANGSHRAMTPEEIIAKIGLEAARQFRVINHDHRAPDLVDMGHTPSGIPIHVNPAVALADLVIGIGSIVPHRYCGWSGGAKIVQPGVCGEETTAATHLMITKDPGVRLGNAENVVRQEMEAVAEKAGLKFIVNTILNAKGQIIDLVAGHPVLAHRAGVAVAMKACAVTVPRRAEIVVAGSHPADTNFWQAGKSLYTADLVAAEPGSIILVTPAFEGIGEHAEFGALLGLKYDEVLRRLEAGLVSDRLSAAAALAVRLAARGRRIVLVTDGLAADQVAAMGFVHYPVERLQAAIDQEIQSYRQPEMLVLKQAPDLLPLVPDDACRVNSQS